VEQFVVCSQNHDQIGNRRMGDRLSATISFEQQKLAAGAVLLSPHLPLIFMGEEYGETAPFQYFVSHSDPVLIRAVREGRRAEFAAFGWQGEIPDPQDERTFQCCRLNPGLAGEGTHRVLRGCYRELLRLRTQLPALSQVRKETLETVAFEVEAVVLVHQWCATDAVTLIFNFATEPRSLELPVPAGEWRKRFDSSDPEWAGPGGLAIPAVSSRGGVRLDLRATAVVLYQKMATA
jgi:maltooligosyltrehalose trehalohydrolase